MNNPVQPNRICPHLGLRDDATTSSGFPSIINACHRSDPIASPRFKHQEEFCLSEKYVKCPVFVRQYAAPLPEDLRIPTGSSEIIRENFRRNLVIILAVFIVVSVLIWSIARPGQFSQGFEKENWRAFPSLVPSSTVTSSPMMTPSPASSLTRTPTSTRASISTATMTPATPPTVAQPNHQLDVLIGTEYKFVIHVVLAEENLDLLAVRYDTSVEAIEMVNYFQSNPGRSGAMLVIPVGFTDVARFPSFVVYQVIETDRGVSVEDLAKNLRVTSMDLKYYNGWTNSGDRPLVGDLLLIPRRRPMP